MAVIGQYKCEIQLNPGPNTLSYRIVVEGYHLGSTDSGPNVEQDWQHTYDWNVGAASTPESHILRQTDQDLSASNPILSAADPVDALFFLPDIGANVLEVTLTPYDAINGAQGSGTAGDPQKLYLGTPASASVMRAENAGGDNIVAPLMKGAGGITMTFANSVIEVDGSGAGGVSGLNDLSDVTITTPVINQHLQYDGAAWVNVTDMTIADGFTLTTSGGTEAAPSIRVDDSQQTGLYSTNGTAVQFAVQGDRVGQLNLSTFAIYNPNATGTSNYTGGFYARHGGGGNVFSITRPSGTDEEWVIRNYSSAGTGHIVLYPGGNAPAELQLVRPAGANLAFSWYNDYTGTPTKVAQLYWDEADGSFQVQASEATSSVALVQNGDKRVEVTSTQTLIRKTDATVAFLVDDAYVETDVTFRPQSVGDLDLGSSSLYWNSIFSETHDWFITTTPVAPASGFGRMWYEGVGVLKVLDSGGTTYTFDATAPTGFTTAGDGLTSSGSTVAVDYLGADSIIAKAPAGSIVSSDEILFMDVDDTSNVKRDLVSSLPFASSAHTHPASAITAETFGAGSYTFPDNVTVNDKLLLGSSPSNANQTIGVTIDQGINTNEAFSIKATGRVAHGYTTAAETAVFFTMKRYDDSRGGAQYISIAESTNLAGIHHQFLFYGGDPQTSTPGPTSVAAVDFFFQEHDGAGALRNATANANIYSFRARDAGGVNRNLLLLRENGEAWFGGQLTTQSNILVDNGSSDPFIRVSAPSSLFDAYIEFDESGTHTARMGYIGPDNTLEIEATGTIALATGGAGNDRVTITDSTTTVLNTLALNTALTAPNISFADGLRNQGGALQVDISGFSDTQPTLVAADTMLVRDASGAAGSDHYEVRLDELDLSLFNNATANFTSGGFDTAGDGLVSPGGTTISLDYAGADNVVLDHQNGTAPALATGDSLLFSSISNNNVYSEDLATFEQFWTITEGQITDGSILARVAANETVSGQWTFTNNVNIEAAVPRLYFRETDQALDEERYRMVVSNADFFFQTRTDADGTGVNIFQVVRGTGTAVTGIDFATNIRPNATSTRDLGTTSLRWANAYVDTLTLTNALAVGSGGTGISGGIAADQFLIGDGTANPYVASGSNLTWSGTTLAIQNATIAHSGTGGFTGDGSGLTGVSSDSSTIAQATPDGDFYPMLADGTSGTISHFHDSSNLRYNLASGVGTLEAERYQIGTDGTMLAVQDADRFGNGGWRFQPTGTNQVSAVSMAPTGTQDRAIFRLYNDSDTANTQALEIEVDGTFARLRAGQSFGTGSTAMTEFYINNQTSPSSGSLRLQVGAIDHLIAGSAAGGSSWVYVPGVLRVGNELRLEDGAVGDPSLAFTSQESTGLYYTTSAINLGVSGNNIATFGGSRVDLAVGLDINRGGGALSIGPGASDHVYMQFYADTAAPTARSGFIGYATAGTNMLDIYNEMGGALRLWASTTGGDINFYPNASLAWTIDATSGGDILPSTNEAYDIGSTTNRVNDLWASYYYVKRENDHPVVQGIRDDATITNVDHLLRLIAQGDLGSGAVTSARIDMTADQTWVQGTARGARITFHTTANDTWASPPERMRIDHNGRVGIGTTSPSTLLEVNGDGATFEMDGPTNGSYMRWRDAGTLRGYLGTANHLVSGASSTNMALRAENNLLFASGSTEVMRITSNANVLIQRTTETLGGGNGALFQIGAGTGGAGMTIHSSTTGNGDIQFADGTVGDASYRGLIRYAHTSDQMQFWAGASVRASVDSGALRSYQPFRGEDGTNALPTYSFANDTDAGMRLTVASNVRISAATDGTFLDVDAVNSRINTNRYLNISESRNELLVLNQANAAGSPYISWKQAGTRRMYLQYNNSNAHTYLVNENGGTIELQTSANEALTVRATTASANPYIALANSGGYTGYWQSYDTGDTFFGTAVGNAPIHIRDFGNSFNLATFDHDAVYQTVLTTPTGKNNVLRLVTSDTTGSPSLWFTQGTNDRAYLEWNNASSLLRFNLSSSTGHNFAVQAGGTTKFYIDSINTSQGYTYFANGQVYAAEYQTQYEDTGTPTLDWRYGNQLLMDFDSTSTTTTINIGDTTMNAGGSYIFLMQYNGGSAQTVAWTSSTPLIWANGDVPTTATGATAGDITVVQFFKTTTATDKIIGSYFVVT